MSDSNRSRYVAIVGSAVAAFIVLIGALTFTFHMGDMSGRKDAEAQGYASAYPNDTSKQISDCWSKPDAESAQECVADAIEASHESQRSEKDLSAQRQMSDWAFWALVVSIVTLVISGTGLFALVITIQQGHTGLERASEANDISRGMGQAGIRAYISIEAGTIQHDDVNNCLIAGWRIVNRGSTPAGICDIVTIATLFDGSSILEYVFTYRIWSANVGHTDIHPLHFTNRKIAKPIYDSLQAAHFECAVFYEDVFEIEREGYSYFTSIGKPDFIFNESKASPMPPKHVRSRLAEMRKHRSINNRL